VPWPTPQEYNEAIQSPRLNFNDPELKGGSVETTPLGLPRPITGGFASVYKMRCGQRDWAVRCFLREFIDQQQRYAAISKHLSAAKLPYTVGFEFLSQGIKVRGTWYPILKMEWVQGELLNKYIKRNLRDSAALLGLASRWAKMIKDMQAASIAHGDLQHGNVLITNGEIRLIDYDGMYVPALAGQSSHEVGHRNYQHPQRTEFDFDSTIDNFAAWVIYVSLLALSIDPSLWDRVQAGDEHLLFRREDFEEPYTSEALTLLSRHADQRLDTLASFFQSLLYSSPTQLPPLDGLPAFQSVSTHSQSIPASSGSKGKPSWLADYVPDSPAVKSTASGETVATESSTWVLDFISPPPTAEHKLLEADVHRPRLVIAVSFIICGLLVILHLSFILPSAAAGVLILTVIMVVAVFLRDYYRRDTVVIAMLEAIGREEEGRQLLETTQRTIKAKETKKIEAREKEKIELKAINSRRAALQDKERREKEQAQARFNVAVSAADTRRQVINRNESDSLRKIQDGIGVEVARLNRQITSLVTTEADELSSSLRRLQEQTMTAHLMSRSIDHATIYGVGEKLKARLWNAGIRTAADVEYWRVTRVEGIGYSKANALLAWRNHVASFARVPTALSQADVSAIKAKYGGQKQQFEAQRDAAQQRLNKEVSAVRAQAANEMTAVNNEQAAAQNRLNQDLRIINDQYAPQYATFVQAQSSVSAEASEQCRKIDEEIGKLRKKMGEQHWQLARVRRDLLSYSEVSFKSYLLKVLGLRTL
jgi:hypothetical protein